MMRPSRRRWLHYGLAIGIGNLLYFSLLPHLPASLQHQVFQLDAGLALDFLLCVALYLLLRRWDFPRRAGSE